MKLLLDENLSHLLCKNLADVFENIEHVKNHSLQSSSDEDVWQYARTNFFIIVTKDSDFVEKSIMNGSPPKIIWIKRGNCSTEIIESLLRKNSQKIISFSSDKEASILILS